VAAQLEKLLRVRLRKCMALLGKVLEEDDPTALRDLRVWSRRLQQVIITLFPKTLPAEGRIIVKALRRARRSLGPWRDCDVLIELLERNARRITSCDCRRKAVDGTRRCLAI
jgi:CHAD domain-containing protein